MTHPRERTPNSVRACATHMHIAEGFVEVFKVLRLPTENEPQPNRDDHFVPSCAIEMDMDIAEGHFYARILRKKGWDPESVTLI